MTLLADPKTKLLTVDEFLAHPDAEGRELIDGVITEKKPMGALSSKVATRLTIRLGSFVEQRNLGHLFDAEATYRSFGSRYTGRRADVSFVRMGRFPGEVVPQGAIDFPADLVVEVVSPTDLAYDVEAKAKLYLDNGFGELWVLFPNTRTVHVRRPGQPGVILNASDTLSGNGPLQGFSCPVRELFPA